LKGVSWCLPGIGDAELGFTIDKYDRLGIGIGYLGDINGDGLAEVALGAFGDDDGGISARRGATMPRPSLD
jgi:hypothetical protein